MSYLSIINKIRTTIFIKIYIYNLIIIKVISIWKYKILVIRSDFEKETDYSVLDEANQRRSHKITNNASLTQR